MSTFSQLRVLRSDSETLQEHELSQFDLVLEKAGIDQYFADLEKAIDANPLHKDELLEKGRKDLSKLVQKTVTDKRGHQRKVWVKVDKDAPKPKQKRAEVISGHDVSFSSSNNTWQVKKNGVLVGDASSKDGAVRLAKKAGRKINVFESQSGPSDTDREVRDVVNDDSLSKSAKARKLIDLGITDKKALADLTGNHYSRICQLMKESDSPSKSASVKSPQIERTQELQHKINLSVDQRWDSYDLFTDMVVSGMNKSIIAFGTGGVGKTYTMSQVMKRHNKVEFDPFDKGHDINTPEEYDYVKITGKSTPTAMYKALYEHNGKIIVFDDCDSVLQDETSINLFKGALDTSGDGTITYDSGRKIKTEKLGSQEDESDKAASIVPNRFKFTGRVIFISNLTSSQMPQPLVDSRSLAVDLSMSNAETIERIRQIIDKMPIEDGDGNIIETTREQRHDAVDFLDHYKDDIRSGKLNARTVGNIIKVRAMIDKTGRKDLDWKQIALTTLAN